MGRPKIRDEEYYREYKRIYAKKAYAINPERAKDASKKYRVNHPDKSKQMQIAHIEKINSDIELKVKHKISMLRYNMIARCYDPKNKRYQHYGGKRISVCSDWINNKDLFYNWCLDNGYKIGLTIDRIDVNKGYDPKNCRFVSQKTQQNNRSNNVRISFNGETKTISEWADIYKISASTLSWRNKKGIMPPLLFAPASKGCNNLNKLLIDNYLK